VLVTVACTSIPFKQDLGFLVSAQANSPEFPVWIGGKLCADLDGQPGMCAKRVRSNDDLVIRFDPQQYVYSVTVTCSSGIPRPPGATVPANTSHLITIPAADFATFRNFTCIGEVAPQDRAPPISSMFRISIVVMDERYLGREVPFITKLKDKRVLVLGQYARTSRVFDRGVWTTYREQTTVPVTDDDDSIMAVSESYASRFNYFRPEAFKRAANQ